MDKSPSDPHQVPDGSLPVPKEKPEDDYNFSQTLDDQYNKAFAKDISEVEDKPPEEPTLDKPVAGSNLPRDVKPVTTTTLHQPPYPEGKEKDVTQSNISSQREPVERTPLQDSKSISEYSKTDDSDARPIETKPQIPPEQEKIQETYPSQMQKKKGGCCNVTTCCMGSCGAILLLVVIITAILLLAPNTVSKALNSIFSPDVTVPVREEVDLDFIEQKLDKVTGEFGTESIVLSEDEFNALAYKRLYEMNTDNMKTELRVDFSSDTSEGYLRFFEWMPWMSFTLQNDENGTVSSGELKLGAWDVSKFSERVLTERLRNDIGFISSSGDVDMYYFFNKILFEGKKGLEISLVDFSQDEISFEIKPTQDIQESGRENPF